MKHLAIRLGEHTFTIEMADPALTGPYCVWLDGQCVQVTIPQAGQPPAAPAWLIMDGRPYEIELDTELRWIDTHHGRHLLEIRDLDNMTVRAYIGHSRIKAPIPGQITRLFVAPEQVVEANQPLCVLEAMKMENEIRAAQAGVVTALPISVGQIVSRGQLLAEITAD
jgi:biotin carboxyl carrier protein